MKLQVKNAFKSHSFLSKKQAGFCMKFPSVQQYLIPYFKICLCFATTSFSKYISNPRLEWAKFQEKMVSFATLVVL